MGFVVFTDVVVAADAAADAGADVGAAVERLDLTGSCCSHSVSASHLNRCSYQVMARKPDSSDCKDCKHDAMRWDGWGG